MIEKYPAIYRDKHGEVKTEIINTFNETDAGYLFMEIDGVHFNGTGFDDFSLTNKENYTVKQLERFCFNKYVSTDQEYWELCDCEIEYKQGLTLIDKINVKTIAASLHVHIILDKPGFVENFKAIITLHFNGQELKSSAGFYEVALSSFEKQLKDNFHFKNCFGCLYGDYSPYGYGFFGPMMCFKKNKKAYLSVTDKHSFLAVIDMGFIQTQETYCCEEFSMRGKYLV